MLLQIAIQVKRGVGGVGGGTWVQKFPSLVLFVCLYLMILYVIKAFWLFLFRCHQYGYHHVDLCGCSFCCPLFDYSLGSGFEGL